MKIVCFFCFKQKTAYEMRISDWSSDVCSSDLTRAFGKPLRFAGRKPCRIIHHVPHDLGSHTGPRSAHQQRGLSEIVEHFLDPVEYFGLCANNADDTFARMAARRGRDAEIDDRAAGRLGHLPHL